MRKIIFWLFGILLFLVPLILWPYTSELFEFNKIVSVYILTTLIAGFWIIRMIVERKFIFRRTILDIPLIIFLGSQVVSTLLSIDSTTSFLGYYSRFNGGLLSIICYLVLYWALVSNIESKEMGKLIKVTLISSVIVSIYGVLERLGIDKGIWQQDVQSRVFSTLGQPNWLAAWIVALLPIAWFEAVKENINKISFRSFMPYLLSGLFFTVLLFTGSRSGLVGFGVTEVIFWGILFIKYKFKFIKPFIISNVLIIVLAFTFGTQWTPSIKDLINKSVNEKVQTIQTGSTSLETGGTESGTIRKIVWQGAIQIWKNYPIFGTGVETFAYSYYKYRPAAHNLTSEWDYVYNKAHNEYLNFLANTGTVGLLSYLFLVGTAIYLFIKKIKFPISSSQSPIKSELTNSQYENLPIALLAGYISILVTNFFGISRLCNSFKY